MPVFYGDKRLYQSWKAAFLACIDAAPVTAEYKLLQLRQYVAGEALYAIDSLGHSAHAYEAAKERLERKFGGKRRQVLIYFEDLGKFPQIRDGNAKDLEQFADLLDSAVISLHEAGKHTELSDGFLYITLQRKLPQSILASYHRWIYENNISESVITLKTWVVQEAEFQTIANEAIHGFTRPSADIRTKRYVSSYDEAQTLFEETGAIQSLQKQILCRLCGANHCIWQCQKYLQKSVPERWNFAKQFRLCYRCLDEGHLGKLCPKSCQCRQNECQKLHHWLLYKPENLSPNTGDLSQTETKCFANAEPKECPLDPATLIGDAFTFSMEGKGKIKQTQTAMTYVTHNLRLPGTNQILKRNLSFWITRSLKIDLHLGIARSLRRNLNLCIARSLRSYLSLGIAGSLRRYLSIGIVRSQRRDISFGIVQSLIRVIILGKM